MQYTTSILLAQHKYSTQPQYSRKNIINRCNLSQLKYTRVYFAFHRRGSSYSQQKNQEQNSNLIIVHQIATSTPYITIPRKLCTAQLTVRQPEHSLSFTTLKCPSNNMFAPEEANASTAWAFTGLIKQSFGYPARSWYGKWDRNKDRGAHGRGWYGRRDKSSTNCICIILHPAPVRASTTITDLSSCSMATPGKIDQCKYQGELDRERNSRWISSALRKALVCLWA